MIIHQELSNSEILVVDDRTENIRLLSQILSLEGYIVRKALNGISALNSIKTSPPNLILLDINMPDMDGYQVCEWLKSNRETQEIPIIFLSALSKIGDKVKAFKVGAADYITKPFQKDEVVIRIRNQLLIQKQQQELLKQNQALRQEIIQREIAENNLRFTIQELERLCIIDSLTKVANRRRFDMYLRNQWHFLMNQQSPLSLILCDIDYFKSYNDYYGHIAGDKCLSDVSQLLISCIQRPDDLLARYGGEEFAVILPNTTIEEAIVTAQSMCNIVANARIVHQQSEIQPFLTISLGVSNCIPNPKISIDFLLNQADKALYESKHKGRNQVNLI